MYELTTALLYAIALTACFQRAAHNLYAAVIFVSFALMHDFIGPDLDGWAYYGSAAILDCIALILLSGIRPVTKMVFHLELILLFSIIGNFLGWVMWVNYMAPTTYDAGFVVLYLLALLALLKGTSNVGDFTGSSWRSCFSGPIYKSLFSHNKQ
tara:strand:+ start:489 stop:950 length:462 start_codon:yes stop_codon:yes gene_type:complete